MALDKSLLCQHYVLCFSLVTSVFSMKQFSYTFVYVFEGGRVVRSLLQLSDKWLCHIWLVSWVKNSEYDQEIPQSQTADKLQKTRGIVRKSHTTITRHLEDKKSKSTNSLFPLHMIAKLEWTQSNAQQT